MCLDIDALVRDVRSQIRGNIPEATVRIRIERLLHNYLESIGVTYQAIHERRTIVTGQRTDSLFGRVVIEYKRPNLLASRAEWNSATEQLEGYILEEAERTGFQPEDYVGILIDGHNIGFIRRVSGEWVVSGPEAINEHNMRLALEYLRGLSRKPLDPDLLAVDFGPESDAARQTIVALWNSLDTSNGKAQMLFQEWEHLFGQVAGYDFDQIPELLEMEREYGIYADGDTARFLFVLHTYYALIIKLLIAEILTLTRYGLGQSFVDHASILDAEGLRSMLQELENGGTFRNLQIENLLEGDFFSWYLDNWNREIAEALHGILIALREYEPSTPMLAPERIKDLLKRLYQHLIPRTLRHDLGEYYTPDWLANWVLDVVGYTGDPDVRILDPACGTATFLVLAINRVKDRAAELGLSANETLQRICSNIAGFDLNPLAVFAARTNYLLALADLLEAQTGPIEIPIYLSDSIFSPSRHDTETGQVCSYKISTQLGPININIPVALIEQGKLGPMLAEIEITVIHNVGQDECLLRVAERTELTPEEVELFGEDIKAIYSQIQYLEAQNWNRIWTRIIKNYYASASIGEFDLVVGNPPWLRWTRLPASYREVIRDYCVNYGLFSRDTYVGGIETDISTILTYSAVEKWLRMGGRLGFLITQTVFKNESSEGFRRFRLPDGTELQVVEVHDMVEIRPFENINNRTAALFLVKGQPTDYPVPYIKWEKTQRDPLREDMTLDEVRNITRRLQLIASPIYDNGGPWLTVEPNLLPVVRRMIGESGYRARKGFTSDLNGVYWIEILGSRGDGLLHFRNRPDTSRHVIQPYEGLIESGVVFPMVRGRDAQPFYVEDNDYYVVVPQDGMRGYPEEEMVANYRNALDYLRRYRDRLIARSSYRRYHLDRSGNELGPFYSLWNIGPYSFAPHKVVWREIQKPENFYAAYLGPKQDPYLGEVPVLPDHKLYFVPCESADEAHYLCGFLNSPAVRAFITGYAIDTQIGSHVTEYINIPQYNPDEPLHVELSRIAARINDERRPPTPEELGRIEQIVERIIADEG